jgi:ubiquinone/menaquinone biosynthesis C-methylase UbiE
VPDQIDLSRMESIPVMGPNGYYRLHRHWLEADGSMWDGIWDKTPSRDYWRDAMAGKMAQDYERLFSKYLMPGNRILEAGCGVGQMVIALRARGFDCVGLDFASRTIEMLNERFPEVPFRQGDIRALPFDTNSFDAYVSLGVIEHFSEGQESMLKEAARVVKPGGWIFLSVPAFNGWRKLRARFGFYDSSATKPFFEACYAVEEVELLLANAGFAPAERSFQNTPMTFAQETPIRPLYRHIEDTRRLRGAVDRLLRLVLPGPMFGHMIMVVARRTRN